MGTSIKIDAWTVEGPGFLHPRITEAKWRRPPEDVGGPWGYAEFLDAHKHPQQERDVEMLHWRGVEALAADVESVAKSWARKPSAKRKRPA